MTAPAPYTGRVIYACPDCDGDLDDNLHCATDERTFTPAEAEQ